MKYLGIDLGSTSAKTVVLNEQGMLQEVFVIPTGWSSFDALCQIQQHLSEKNILIDQCKCVSTGYGREAVSFSEKKITEITCHAKGAAYLFGNEPINIIDIGGQDTKVISATNGKVEEFFMNDKCSAGTGKFIEIMANRLAVPIESLDSIAQNHTEKLEISSMCTVFAESEVVALIGKGSSKENIAWGVLNSVVRKVSQEYTKLTNGSRAVYITGGLCENNYFRRMLSKNLRRTVNTDLLARYAGAIGAACIAMEIEKGKCLGNDDR